MAKFNSSGKSPDSYEHGSWLYFIRALLRSFLSDYVPREAHDALSCTTHSDREDESKFSEMLSSAACLRRHDFKKDEFINFYVQGLGNQSGRSSLKK